MGSQPLEKVVRLLKSGEEDISLMYYHTEYYQSIWTCLESLWSEDQAYLTSDDGGSALWKMMPDYSEAGEQTSHTFGSFTCERSLL